MPSQLQALRNRLYDQKNSCITLELSFLAAYEGLSEVFDFSRHDRVNQQGYENKAEKYDCLKQLKDINSKHTKIQA